MVACGSQIQPKLPATSSGDAEIRAMWLLGLAILVVGVSLRQHTSCSALVPGVFAGRGHLGQLMGWLALHRSL